MVISSPVLPTPAAALHTMELLGELAAGHMRSQLGAAAIMKGDGTPVTQVDLELNALVLDVVARRHPGCDVIGEEASSLTDSTHVFVVDPIDGTATFAAGFGLAAFAMAFIVDGVPQASLICDPFAGMTFAALKGVGATVNGTPLRIPARPAGSMVQIEATNRTPLHNGVAEAAVFAAGFSPVRHYAFIGPAARVATGSVAAAAFVRDSLWDTLPVAVLCAEAGAKVTTVTGEPSDGTTPGGLLVAHPAVHAELVAALAPLMTPS